MGYYLLPGSHMISSAKAKIGLVSCDDFSEIGIEARYAVHLICFCPLNTCCSNDISITAFIITARVVVKLVAPPGSTRIRGHGRRGEKDAAHHFVTINLANAMCTP